MDVEEKVKQKFGRDNYSWNGEKCNRFQLASGYVDFRGKVKVKPGFSSDGPEIQQWLKTTIQTKLL